MCARNFFSTFAQILLILVLLLRCCHRVSCTNLGLENFARYLGLLLAVCKQHAFCMHTNHNLTDHSASLSCTMAAAAAGWGGHYAPSTSLLQGSVTCITDWNSEERESQAPLGLLVRWWRAIAQGALFSLLELVSPRQSCTMSP